MAGRFGKLLTNAYNEIREEEDTLYAIDQQAEEAVSLITEWVVESQDLAMAQELAEALEQERDCQKRLELIQGEAEAVRIAVEEKRRIKAESQAKIDREKADELFAKQLAEEEVKYFSDRKQQYEDDEKYSYELDQEEKRGYESKLSDSKDYKGDGEFVIPDKEDDDLDTAAEKVVSRTVSSSSSWDAYDCDEKPSRRRSTSLSRPPVLEEKLTPVKSIPLHAEQEVPLSPETTKQNKRAKRSQLQRVKFDNEIPSTHVYKKYNFSSVKDENIVSKIWEKANVEIAELHEALVLMIQLPNIQRLHIGMENQGRTMRIKAKRYVRNNGSSSKSSNLSIPFFSTDSTQYNAEFFLDGEICVTTQDIYHEYYQEYGLLFIYVENICLDRDNEGESASGKMLGKGKNLLNSFKNNFMRVFGK